MVAPNKFQSYLQSILNTSKKYIQQGGRDCYISTLAELPLQVQTTTSSTPDPQEQQKERQEQFTVLEGLRKYAPECVLLVGKPGSGKSTSLRQLLYEEAERCVESNEQGKSEIPPIPILIELRNLSGSVLSAIQGKLEWWLDLEKKALKLLLRNQRLLVLLDGLNELPNREAWQEVDQFRQLCIELKIPLIITTRELGSDFGYGCIKRLEMLPLTKLQMQNFVHQRLPEMGRELLRQIQGQLQELAETPLLLQMLCDVFAEKGELPRSRGDLFRKEFVRRYEKFKPERLRNVSEDSRRFTFDLLCYFAFTMVRGEPHTDPCKPTAAWITLSKTQAAKILARFLANARTQTFEDTVKAKEWLEDLVEWHLLQVVSDPDCIEFHHQLFQEYYAGEQLILKLAEFTDEELKHYYFNYLKWTEPLAMSMSFVESEALAVRMVKLALDVDLKLGARLAGEAQLSLQEFTVNVLLKRNSTTPLTIWLLEQTQSPNALPFLLDVLKNGCSDTRWRAARALGNFSDATVLMHLIEALKDRDSSVRHKAAESLGKLGNLEAIPHLCQLLNDEDWLVRSFVVEILGSLEGTESVDCLKKALINKDSIVKKKAAEYLGQRASQEVVTLLGENFANGDADIKKDILMLLGETKNVAAVPTLIHALSEDNWIIRSQAVSSIGLLGIWLDKSLLEDASTALIRILKSDPEISVRSGAALYLGCIGDSRVVPVLTEVLFQDAQEIVRVSAVNALGRLQDRSAINAIIRSLQDNDYVCEAAIRAIRVLNAAEALPSIRKLAHCKVINIRREAILTLGFIGDSKDLPYLYKTLQDKEFSIRLRAAYALSQLNNRKGASILEDALKTGNTDARKLALDGLKNFKGKVGLSSILLRAFNDDEYSIQKASINFLEFFGDTEEVVEQLKIALDSKDEDVCRNAMDAAKTLGNAGTLLRLRQLAETITVVERPMDAIAAIQSRCQFYNFEICKSLPTTPSVPISPHTALLHIINQTTQATSEKINQMADQPKVQMTFQAPVENAVGNVEGDMIVNSASLPIREATTKIASLLSNLHQKHPDATDEEILDILTQDFNTMPQQNLQNWQRWQDLFSVFFAGGVETIKLVYPPVGIPIEVLKRLYEIYDRNRKQLPGS
jgi:HEAT repeat protein/energy-coupling factor transporter ATP-binding protein EcfA2